MGTLTPKIGLYKPADQEFVEVNDINGNSDKTDLLIGTKITTAADMSSPAFNGQTKHETDTGVFYVSSGAGWAPLINPAYGVPVPAPQELIQNLDQQMALDSWEDHVSTYASFMTTPCKFDVVLSQPCMCRIDFYVDFYTTGTYSTTFFFNFAVVLSGATSSLPTTIQDYYSNPRGIAAILTGKGTDGGVGEFNDNHSYGSNTFTYRLLTGTTTVEVKGVASKSIAGIGNTPRVRCARLQVTPMYYG
jgi:hypothetical protein